MRYLSILLLVSALYGCASPVNPIAGSTYWVEGVELELSGQHEDFLSREAVRQRLVSGLSQELVAQNSMATSKSTADFVVDVDVIYARNIQNDKLTEFATGSVYLVNAAVGYEIKLRDQGGASFTLKKNAQTLYPHGVMHDLQSLMSMVSRSANKHTEDLYLAQIQKNIVGDLLAGTWHRSQ